MKPIHPAPVVESLRTVEIGTAKFEVAVGFVEPEEDGMRVPTEHCCVECIKIGGAWWMAEDVLDSTMYAMIDTVLRMDIASERDER